MRHHRVGYRSPSRRHIRSPSPQSDHRSSARGLKRHNISRSPINTSSISPSPRPVRSRSPRKQRARKELSPSVSASEFDFRRREKEAAPSGEHIKSDCSNPSPGESKSVGESLSVDYSSKRSTHIKRLVTGKLALAGGDRSSYTSLDEGSLPRASGSSYYENDPVSSAHPRSASNMDCPKHMQDRALSGNDGVGYDLYDETRVVSSGGIKLHDSILENNPNQDHLNSNNRSLSPENSLCDDVGHKKSPCEGKEDTEVDMFENASTASEHAAHLSPKSNQNENGDFQLLKGRDELNHELCYGIQTSVMLPDRLVSEETELVSGIPTACVYPQERSKRRSRETRRKHRKRRHKKHRRGESEEDNDYRRENRSKRKRKRHEKKARKRHHKDHQERKRKTHQDMS
ncbi:uncharacterized protein LOC143877134 [Tasmannia lanceolata]|uniref:uncharacterized protein LOC143877134 n=1 Tax=Tasmannia lanceolata TaxID=3420 RepID=UPI004063BFD9